MNWESEGEGQRSCLACPSSGFYSHHCKISLPSLKKTLKGKEGKNWIVDWANVSSILCSYLVPLASLCRWLWLGPPASTFQELELHMPELLQFHKIEEKRIIFEWKGNSLVLQENGCVPLFRSFLFYHFGLKYKIFASLGLALNNSWRPGDNQQTTSANIKHREICF